jgi:hypothetical protein
MGFLSTALTDWGRVECIQKVDKLLAEIICKGEITLKSILSKQVERQ